MKPVIVLLAIFFLISFLRKRSVKPPQKAAPRHDSDARPKSAGEEMVFDTVCNSYIPVSSAISLKVNGELEYFCSEECREKFRQGQA